ncbi:MAG: response regulator [Chryseobacterium sp.]|nr:MAG: response regulator [Chryseobacterium sp.]
MNSKKILVIDDDSAILDSLELMLDFEGYEVCVHECGADGLKTAEMDKPDLILLDMWLSGEDGRDICRTFKLQEHTRNTPVIMMSASRGLENTAIEAGADAFVAKPFEMDMIVQKVREYVS